MRLRKPRSVVDLAVFVILHVGDGDMCMQPCGGTLHTWSLGSDSWRQRTRMSIASRQPKAWLPLADLSPLAPSFGTRSGWLARRWLSCRYSARHVSHQDQS